MKPYVTLIALIFTLLLFPQRMLAQNALVTDFLEKNLSVSGQTVKVSDLQGALSGDLTIGAITIADDAGIWFRLEGGRLNWSRTALLTGALNIQDLSAQRITIFRRPSLDAPTPARQSGPISLPQLPDLPITAQIDRFAIQQIIIADAYDDGPLIATSTGSLAYGAGILDAALILSVTNGRQEVLDLTTRITAQDQISAQLKYSEQAGGAVAQAAGFIHNAPLTMTLQAQGNSTNIKTNIALTTGQTSTDQMSHVAGTFDLTSDTQGSHIRGTVSGDLSPLIDTPISALKRAGRIDLMLDATRAVDNTTHLRTLSLTSDVLSLNGALNLDETGWPTALDITANVEPDVLAQDLARSGFDATQLGRGQFSLRYDQSLGQAWALDASFDNVTFSEIAATTVTATGRGTIQDQTISGTLDSSMGNVTATGALSDLLWGDVTLNTGFAYGDGTGVTISGLTLTTPATQFRAGIRTDPAYDAVDIAVDAVASDLSRFAALANLPKLRGAGDISATGRIAPKTGGFDIAATVQGRGIAGVNTTLDPLMTGDTVIDLMAKRDSTGTYVDRLSITNQELSATASAALTLEQGRLYAQLRLANAGLLDASLSGPIAAEFKAIQSAPTKPWTANGTLRANQNTDLAFSGVYDANTLRDIALQGQVNAALANGFISPHTVKGAINFDLFAQTLADRKTVRGTANMANGTLAIQGAPLPIQNIDLRADLTQGRTRVTSTATLGRKQAAMTTDGIVDLTPNGRTQIAIKTAPLALPLANGVTARLKSDVTVTGVIGRQLTLDGTVDLLDLIVDLGQVSGGSNSALDVRHINMSNRTRTTLDTLGVLSQPNARAGSDRPDQTGIALNLDIRAPNKLFARGRGIDAEFGGTVRVGGTTSTPIPTGQFDLIRGRMDLLTKRVRLTQGRLQLLGTLDPDIYLKADVDAQDGDILSVEIAGRSSAPELILSSQSGRPSEEVLAEVLFGKALEGLSTFQTIQLVNAFRTLGSPNPSFMERMRRMSGLDDFDITQDEQGDLSVSAGKYIRDNTYVEFEFGSGGKAETRLNLDLNRRTKTFISHDTNGDSQIGITFGQDYE